MPVEETLGEWVRLHTVRNVFTKTRKGHLIQDTTTKRSAVQSRQILRGFKEGSDWVKLWKGKIK